MHNRVCQNTLHIITTYLRQPHSLLASRPASKQWVPLQKAALRHIDDGAVKRHAALLAVCGQKLQSVQFAVTGCQELNQGGGTQLLQLT